MTPYDVAAVRLGDGLELAGSPPPDVERYLAALRADRSTRAIALVRPGGIVAGPDVIGLVERLTGTSWADAEAAARGAGALLGAYPAEE